MHLFSFTPMNVGANSLQIHLFHKFKNKRSNMKSLILTLFLCTIATMLSSQATIQWQKCLGGSKGDEAYSIQQTSDGGYVMAGYTHSSNGDVTGHHGDADFWIVKLSSAGVKEWQKALGGSAPDYAESIKQTPDGGYIVAGRTNSTDGDVLGNHGSWDGWLVKLSATGSLQWQRPLGGSDWDEIYDVQLANDGGYVVTGQTGSDDGDAIGADGFSAFWVLKLSSAGVLEWHKPLGGDGVEYAYSLGKTAEGGYIVAGRSSSKTGDLTKNNGEDDYWIVKLNSTGSIVWQKSYGGSKDDQATSVEQTADGGYIVAGYSQSTNGDISGNNGYDDFWVIKLNSTGDLVWEKALGGTSFERYPDIHQTSDGGYIMAGLTASNNGDVVGNHGNRDVWVVKLSNDGTLLWSKTYGGSDCDDAYAIIQTNDGGFAVAGGSCSYGGDVSGNHGNGDAWILKLNATSVGTYEANLNASPQQLDIFPNPTSGALNLYFPVAGSERIQVTISDLFGRQIASQIIENGSGIDLSSIPSGFYVASCATASGHSATAKFVRQTE